MVNTAVLGLPSVAGADGLDRVKLTVRGPLTPGLSRIATEKVFGVASPSAQDKVPEVLV